MADGRGWWVMWLVMVLVVDYEVYEEKHTVHHHRIAVDGWVVDLDTLQVEVGCILLVQHSVRNVRNVHARVAFAGDVDLAAVQVEGVDEVLEPAVELGSHVFLVVDCRGARGEACAGGLVNVDHVGEVGP